jgi:small subunit ribosomal protein S7
MARRKKTNKREIVADPVFGDVAISKFINKMMYDGKKSTAQRMFFGALDELKDKVPGEEAVNVFS